MSGKPINSVFAEDAFTLKRVTAKTGREFAEVVERFERIVHRLDPNQKAEDAQLSADGLRKRLSGLAAPSGFVLLGKIEHGLLERLGRPGRSVQYAIGNPLVAADITAYDLGVGLYAPFRLGIFEDLSDGGTTIMFDDPADLMGSFAIEHVAEVGRMLSAKVRDLIAQCL
ncbi:DUF302 domain-containing protein [Novosphingobium sp.]|uniref:DUF302 domain-containing protein n=1 Tax=Novosphingobium sp. TaxID=1874826 RepID=UPI0031DB7621